MRALMAWTTSFRPAAILADRVAGALVSVGLALAVVVTSAAPPAAAAAGAASGPAALVAGPDGVAATAAWAPRRAWPPGAPAPQPALRAGSDTSTNWAGLVATGAQWTGVSASWTVPAVSPTGVDAYSATWVGIDGYSNSSLIQTGTEQDSAASGASQYFAWYEILPAPATYIGPVAPGDQMTASVSEDSPGTWTIAIKDVTSGQSFSGSFSYDGPASSAEWIEEAPTGSSGQVEPLADFGSVTLGNLAVATPAASSATLTPITMVNSAGQVIAYPGAFDQAQDSFSVFYGSPQGGTAPTGSASGTAGPCPAGTSSCSRATSTTSTGSATAVDGEATVTASGGTGTVTVGQYPSDPVGPPDFVGASSYLDLELSSGATFGSVALEVCDVGVANTLYWWDPSFGAWEQVAGAPGPTYAPGPPACVSVTLDASTSPALSGLTGTVFALGLAPIAEMRLAGENRDLTAVATAEAEFPTAGSAKAAVLASDADFPDALAGGPLAAAVGGPLLVTTPSALDPAVGEELERVLPQGATVYVLGGEAALSPEVAAAVQALGFTVDRVAGNDRFATALAIAATEGDPTTVFLATGLDFPDGLAATPAAVAAHAAILLTNGSTLPSSVAAYLAAHPGTVVAVGGPACRADPEATCYAGADRYATAVALAEARFAAPRAIGVATGLSFPDALTGGVATAMAGGPLLLVPSSGALPASVASYLSSTPSIDAALVFGGDAAVDGTVAAEVAARGEAS
jgi:hypothetical protein